MSDKTIQDFLKDPYLKDLIDVSHKFHMHGRYIVLNNDEYKGVAFATFPTTNWVRGMTDEELFELSNSLEQDGEYIPLRCKVFKLAKRDPFIVHHNVVEHLRNAELLTSCSIAAKVEYPERVHIEKFAHIKKHAMDTNNYNFSESVKLDAAYRLIGLMKDTNEARWSTKRYTPKHTSKQARAYKNSITLRKLKSRVAKEDIGTIEIPANKAGAFKHKMRHDKNALYSISWPYTTPRLKETRLYEKSCASVSSEPLVTVHFDKNYKSQVYEAASILTFGVDASVYRPATDAKNEVNGLVIVPSNKLKKFTGLCKEKGIKIKHYRGLYRYGFAPFTYPLRQQKLVDGILWGLLKEAEAFHIHNDPKEVPNYNPKLGVNNKPKDIVDSEGKTLAQLLAEENRTAIKPLNVTVIKGKVPYNDFSR